MVKMVMVMRMLTLGGKSGVCLMKPGGTVAAEDWSLLPATNYHLPLDKCTTNAMQQKLTLRNAFWGGEGGDLKSIQGQTPQYKYWDDNAVWRVHQIRKGADYGLERHLWQINSLLLARWLWLYPQISDNILLHWSSSSPCLGVVRAGVAHIRIEDNGRC